MHALEVDISKDAQEFYERFGHRYGETGQLVYVAEQWFEELLEPLDYGRCDQDRVFKALSELKQAGLMGMSTVKTVSGYQASRRADYPRPRRVTITILR